VEEYGGGVGGGGVTEGTCKEAVPGFPASGLVCSRDVRWPWASCPIFPPCEGACVEPLDKDGDGKRDGFVRGDCGYWAFVGGTLGLAVEETGCPPAEETSEWSKGRLALLVSGAAAAAGAAALALTAGAWYARRRWLR